ncbi:MAG: hypothetical protein ACKVP0_15095 [Pirellulaceae bacterium]
MYAWLLIASLATSAEPLEDGTLLFLENCSSFVERTTHGSVGHVAIVMHEEQEAWVYEAIPGKVRRLKVDEYYAELSRLNARKNEEQQIHTFALRPEKPFSQTERQAMRHYLDEQIGRRYSVKGYVRGKESAGVHCAELASHTLNESGRYHWEHCHSINPSKLQELIDPTYREPAAVNVPPFETDETWCERAQRRWDSICNWCSWSCGEAWSFCR